MAGSSAPLGPALPAVASSSSSSSCTAMPTTAAEAGATAMPGVDPNEPVYCLCRQIAFGDMVGCDNPSCAYEWFHFGCVGLVKQPPSTWLCPPCVAERRRLEGRKSWGGRGRKKASHTLA
jgi:hypothetical protein